MSDTTASDRPVPTTFPVSVTRQDWNRLTQECTYHDEIEFDAMPILESLKFEELPEPGSDPSLYWLFGLAQGAGLCEQWGGPFEVYGPFDEDNEEYVTYYEWRRKNDASA